MDSASGGGGDRGNSVSGGGVSDAPSAAAPPLGLKQAGTGGQQQDPTVRSFGAVVGWLAVWFVK